MPTPLPKETTPPCRLHHALAPTLAAIAAAFLLNLGCLWYLKHYTTNWAYYLHGKKWDMLLGLETPADWLILGDSSGSIGVDPAVLAQNLGGTALNLCTTAGGTLLESLWMLEAHLKRLGPPKNLILVIGIGTWSKPPNITAVSRAPLIWLSRHKIQPNPLVGLGPTNTLAFLSSYLPLYSAPETLKDMVLYPWHHTWFRNALDEKLSPSGFLALEEHYPDQVRQQAASLLEDCTAGRDDIDAFNRQSLLRIAQLSRQHGFGLFIANGPLYDALYRQPCIQAYYPKIDRLIDRAAAVQPNLRRLFRRPPTFALDDLVEMVDHLTAPAAQAYSRRMAAALVR